MELLPETAIGTSTITVTTADGGKTAICNVTVTEVLIPHHMIAPTIHLQLVKQA